MDDSTKSRLEAAATVPPTAGTVEVLRRVNVAAIGIVCKAAG